MPFNVTPCSVDTGGEDLPSFIGHNRRTDDMPNGTDGSSSAETP
jgi:hypothetical protein